jgi:hypothetical protein
MQKRHTKSIYAEERYVRVTAAGGPGPGWSRRERTSRRAVPRRRVG